MNGFGAKFDANLSLPKATHLYCEREKFVSIQKNSLNSENVAIHQQVVENNEFQAEAMFWEEVKRQESWSNTLFASQEMSEPESQKNSHFGHSGIEGVKVAQTSTQSLLEGGFNFGQGDPMIIDRNIEKNESGIHNELIVINGDPRRLGIYKQNFVHTKDLLDDKGPRHESILKMQLSSESLNLSSFDVSELVFKTALSSSNGGSVKEISEDSIFAIKPTLEFSHVGRKNPKSKVFDDFDKLRSMELHPNLDVEDTIEIASDRSVPFFSSGIEKVDQASQVPLTSVKDVSIRIDHFIATKIDTAFKKFLSHRIPTLLRAFLFSP